MLVRRAVVWCDVERLMGGEVYRHHHPSCRPRSFDVCSSRTHSS